MGENGDRGPARGDPAQANGEPAQGDEPCGASAERASAEGAASGGEQAEGAANAGGGADRSVGGERADEPARDRGEGDQSRAGSGGAGTARGASATASGPARLPDPGELLGEVRAIRRRARLARHAYWFPLVVFGVLTLASVPFYIRRNPAGSAAFDIGGGLRVLQSGFLGGPGLLEVAEGTAYYWLGAMLLGITATVLWYRWRGDRIGLRTPARSYLITALALVALALLIPVVSGRSFRMPLLWPGDYVTSGLFPLVLIGLGLFVLAWSERSTGLAAIAAGYLAVSVVANLYILSNVLDRLHWNLSPAAAAVPNVVLPALVLLLAGAGAWAVQRRYRPAAEFEADG